jgi:hypothetical protein
MKLSDEQLKRLRSNWSIDATDNGIAFINSSGEVLGYTDSISVLPVEAVEISEALRELEVLRGLEKQVRLEYNRFSLNPTRVGLRRSLIDIFKEVVRYDTEEHTNHS